MSVFVADLKKIEVEGKMDEFQEFLDKVAEETINYISELAQKLNITEACAEDVWYLRTRSRWSQELEDKLIELHKAGTPPNIMGFGCGYKDS